MRQRHGNQASLGVLDLVDVATHCQRSYVEVAGENKVGGIIEAISIYRKRTAIHSRLALSTRPHTEGGAHKGKRSDKYIPVKQCMHVANDPKKIPSDAVRYFLKF